MKFITILTILSIVPFPTSTYNPAVLDYALRTLQYLTAVHAGVFSCVFYDADPDRPFDNSILEAILKSPQLDHITVYVTNVSYHIGLEQLPREPSVLLVSFGGNSSNYVANVAVFLKLFDPATKVLVFVNRSEEFLLKVAALVIYRLQFTYSVFIDSLAMEVMFCNGVNWGYRVGLPEPMYLFEKDRRRMTGRKVAYIGERNFGFSWNALWLEETVRYLHTESVVLKHNCKGGGESFYRCLHSLPDGRGNFDIFFSNVFMPSSFGRGYNFLTTNIPVFFKIAVPRDRPLNVAELFLMPFSWQVWTLLAIVIVCSEVFKHLYPVHFRNDPFLLTVCGCERHNLHRAGRREKTAFFALIVLMFFATTAFEKKIVALMTSKPSIQRIKTVTDLLESNVKFYADLKINPHLKNQSIVGKMYVQGDPLSPLDTIPGVGMFAQSEVIDLLKDTAFDYDRQQSFYVVLDYASFEGPETYMTGWRSLFTGPFRLLHDRLVEAGLFNHWKRQYQHAAKVAYVGSKFRTGIVGEHYLIFDDLHPAWMVLAIGWSVSLVGFLGENVRRRFDPKGVFRSIRKSYPKGFKKYIYDQNK